MRVLGISPLDKDATVSFMEDGQVVFACAEERLSRVKLQSGFPERAIQLGLKKTGWTAQSIDVVAYAFFDWNREANLIQENMSNDACHHSSRCTEPSLTKLLAVKDGEYRVDRSMRIPGWETEGQEFLPPKSWWKRLAYDKIASSPSWDWQAHRSLFKRWTKQAIADHRHWSQALSEGLKRHQLDGKLHRFHHHDTHAANAFYASEFPDALVITLDGYGSGCCGGVYLANDQCIKNLHRFAFPNSLGIFYEHVTSGLGFKPSRHEGKIVGLAAYGDAQHLADVILDRFEVKDGDIRIRAALNHFFTRGLTNHFAKRDIAAAYQFVLEEVTRRMTSYWQSQTGQSRVVVSGGVHANVKLNQRIREIPGIDEVFVYPNMGDGGCGTGAAMLVFGHDVMKKKSFDMVYFGPEYSDQEIRSALDTAELQYDQHDEIEEKIADLLAQDYIIGRFHGRMEYGPRALGNRSVLYPAKEPEVNQWLNQQLGRTEFMPFAPAALAEAAPRLFKNLSGCEKTSRFMTITFDCTDEMKRLCPAAVHVDGTARPQLVTESSNPSFFRILRAYEARTGTPALINTSFNMHEEPIVCSPQDAIRAFLLGNIDFLAIENFLVPHPQLKKNLRNREKPEQKLQPREALVQV
jgi:carbamoyltransferase